MNRTVLLFKDVRWPSLDDVVTTAYLYKAFEKGQVRRQQPRWQTGVINVLPKETRREPQARSDLWPFESARPLITEAAGECWKRFIQ